MEESKEDLIKIIAQNNGNKNRNQVEAALHSLHENHVKDGLDDHEFERLAQVLTANKLASPLCLKLLHCLIPKTSVPDGALKELLSWFFSDMGSKRMSKSLETQFISWITGITHYELGNADIIDSYLHSFLFLLKTPHLEAVVCKLLCLLFKPEDAKRWVVRKILDVRQKVGPKAHINSLLSILKSFRPDVVPESVPMIRMNYENSPFQSEFQRANERRSRSGVPENITSVTWHQFRLFDKKSRDLGRLIPDAETLNLTKKTKTCSKIVSVTEIQDMASLGVHHRRIEMPAQILSLLRNSVGFHLLAFGDTATKNRFCHKLHYTLFRVFILELEPYSRQEKSEFLNALISFQEFVQQGIPVVTEFLLHYFLVWDGEDFKTQIFKLIQWTVIGSEKDWSECFFRPLRALYRSAGAHWRYLLLESLGDLLRNVIAFRERSDFTFRGDASEGCDAASVVRGLATFVGELATEGLLWSGSDAARWDVVTASLDFYDVCSLLEYSADFPVVCAMPPALVYTCLLSGNKVFLSRMCSLLIEFWDVASAVLRSGRSAMHKVEIEQMKIYITDYYRCLWGNMDYERGVTHSFLFHDENFERLSLKLKGLGVNAEALFYVSKNSTLWDGSADHDRDNWNKLGMEYPHVVAIKQFFEEQVA